MSLVEKVPTPFADFAERDPALAALALRVWRGPGRAYLWLMLRDRAEEAGAPPALLDQVDAWRRLARNRFLAGQPRRERQRRIQAFQYYFDAMMGTLGHARRARAERLIPF